MALTDREARAAGQQPPGPAVLSSGQPVAAQQAAGQGGSSAPGGRKRRAAGAPPGGSAAGGRKRPAAGAAPGGNEQPAARTGPAAGTRAALAAADQGAAQQVAALPPFAGLPLGQHPPAAAGGAAPPAARAGHQPAAARAAASAPTAGPIGSKPARHAEPQANIPQWIPRPSLNANGWALSAMRGAAPPQPPQQHAQQEEQQAQQTQQPAESAAQPAAEGRQPAAAVSAAAKQLDPKGLLLQVAAAMDDPAARSGGLTFRHIEILTRLVDTFPNHLANRLLLIQAYLSQQRYLEAAKLIEGAAGCVMHA